MFLGIHGFNQQNRQAGINGAYWSLLKLMLPGVSALKGFSYYTIAIWQTIINILNPKQIVIRINHEDDLPNLLAVYRSGVLDGREVILEILNEPNLEIGDIATFISRYEAIEAWLRANCSLWAIAFPGLSPGLSPGAWWTACAALIARARYLCIHLYYNQPGNYKQQQNHLDDAKKLGKPLIASEFCYTGGEAGHVRPTSELAPEYRGAAQWLADEGVEAMYDYLLGSDDPHWSQVGEVFDATMARALGTLQLIENQGGNTMFKDQFPEVFAQWEAAGGVENNFEAHLIGIGVLPPTKERVIKLTGQLTATVNQIVGAITSLPLA